MSFGIVTSLVINWEPQTRCFRPIGARKQANVKSATFCATYCISIYLNLSLSLRDRADTNHFPPHQHKLLTQLGQGISDGYFSFKKGSGGPKFRDFSQSLIHYELSENQIIFGLFFTVILVDLRLTLLRLALL